MLVKMLQEDIDNGTSCKDGMCAVDLAIKRTLDVNYVTTGFSVARAYKEGKSHVYSVIDMGTWIAEFEVAVRKDLKSLIKPKDFEIIPIGE